MAKFILSSDAENDLIEIWDYIAEDNIDAADGLIRANAPLEIVRELSGYRDIATLLN